MKIIVVGYGEMFRSVISGILNTCHEIVGVFRHENTVYNPLTRFYKDIFHPSYDYNFIKTQKLHEIKAPSVNSESFRRQVKKLDADIIITASWSEKFSPETINSPKIACINLHPALLPKYRGPNPYLQVILHNESTSGITFHLMTENYDSGAILHQQQTPVYSYDTGLSLKQRCCKLAAKEVQFMLDDFDEKLKNAKEQREDIATYYPNILLKEIILDFTNETAQEIDRRIRALTPWVHCHVPYKNEFLIFKKHEILPETSAQRPATIIKKADKSIYIVCKDGSVIKFTDLKTTGSFSNILSGIYFEKFINVNEKAI
jgi:methionyl-tRNA formyltransferase